jgi:aspartate racemase
LPKHIGIAAVSPEGSAICYRMLGRRASDIQVAAARPAITLHNRPFSTYVESLERGDWVSIADSLRDSAKALAAAGASFCILPDNVCHHALPLAETGSPIPWLNMIDLVAQSLQARGCKHIGLIGTRYVTYGSTYQIALGLRGMHLHVPPKEEADNIDRLIFTEAVFNRVSPQSRASVRESVSRLKDRGCEALILGTTEGSLLLPEGDSPLPIVDPLEVLVDAAIGHAAD